MKLYNQTNKPLAWDISLTRYFCEPYGEVSVPDIFVEHCKVRGLPLAAVPVAAEVKASKALETASSSAKSDETANLLKQLNDANASAKSAKDELESKLGKIAVLERDFAAKDLEVKNSEEKFTKLLADHNALNKLFEEQAKELEVKKLELEKAMATIDVLKKPVVKDPEPAKPVQNSNQNPNRNK